MVPMHSLSRDYVRALETLRQHNRPYTHRHAEAENGNVIVKGIGIFSSPVSSLFAIETIRAVTNYEDGLI